MPGILRQRIAMGKVRLCYSFAKMRAAAVILAAGKGERMGGVAKAALRRPDGPTFLEAIVRTARAGGCRHVVVVVGSPHETTVRALAEAVGADAVAVNLAPERGMASSLAAGLATLDGGLIDVALSWPVDHPFVVAETVTTVVSLSGRSRIVVPRYRARGGHPTAFGADVWKEIEAAVDAPDGARSVVQRDERRVARVDVADEGVTLDVDE